jgi:hypothetical protein
MLTDSAPKVGFPAAKPGDQVPVGIMVCWPRAAEVDEVFARAVEAGGTAEGPLRIDLRAETIHQMPGLNSYGATAAFCIATSFATPPLASRSRPKNSSSEKGLPSAVPCTSTRPPDPVMTKLASVSAAESSA